MPYSLEFANDAAEGLSRLDNAIARQVRGKIDWLAENAETIRHEPMTGQFRDKFRIRVGSYRAIYDLDQTNRRITVLRIGHRRDVYLRW